MTLPWLKTLDSQRKELQQQTEALQNQRNARSRDIASAKAAGEDSSAMLAAMTDLKQQLEAKKQQLQSLQQQLTDYLMKVPNAPFEDVPEGENAAANQLVSSWGEPPAFDFSPRDHVALGEQLGGLDFAAASQLTGARFVVMRGALASLHRALGQFMLDLHGRQHGYTEINVPYIVNQHSLLGTGQLPRFEDDLFKLRGEHQYYLIPLPRCR